MVLRRLSLLAALFLVACQPLPDFEKENLTPSRDLHSSHISSLRLWMWSCRAQPKAKSLPDFEWKLSVEMDRFFSFFKERGLSLVDIEPSKIFLGSAFLWNREGFLILPLNHLDQVNTIECRGPDTGWLSAEIFSRDETIDLALLKVDLEADANYENFRIWKAQVERPRPESPLSLLASAYPGAVDQQRVWLQAYRANMQTGMDDDLLFFQPPPSRLFAGGVLMSEQGKVAGYVFHRAELPWGMALRLGALSRIVQSRIDGEKPLRAYFGFRLRFETDKGFVVQSVDQASPARRSGLQAQDVLKTWDGKELKALEDWPKSILTQLNRPLKFKFEREGEVREAVMSAVAMDD